MSKGIPVHITHTSSSSQRMSRTNISILEESEPCELHDILSCKKCDQIQKERATSFLKRSISTNAMNTSKRRPSIISLHRTMSQTSCYSTGSTQTLPTELKNDSFCEFLDYLKGDDDQYKKANNLWEILPQETKDIFINRVITKKRILRNQNLATNDLKHILIKEYIQKKKSTSQNKAKNKLNEHIQKEQLLSQIMGRLFDEMNKQDSIQSTSKGKQTEDGEEELMLLFNTKCDESINTEKMEQSNSALDRIRMWRDKQEINTKIKELNSLLERYEQLSPLPTPVTDEENISARSIGTVEHGCGTIKAQRSLQKDTFLKSHQCPPNEEDIKIKRRETFMGIISSKSKKLLGRFKHKKKPASLDLYRKPNPKIKTLAASAC